MSTKPQTAASSNVGNRSEQSESAKAAKRTWAFVIAAIGCLLITGLFEWYSRPAAIEEYGKVGQEFYPEFSDPTTATSLTVSVIDPEEVKPLEFSVKQAENGQWVIPSHHDYPADAADQLAKTASSVIGIKRGAMVTRWPSDHARYGVVDPQTDSVGIDELEGIGKRITLGGQDGTVLASYIVGKKAEGAGNQYYVRHPGEDETYIADLDINLSTRFSDWVNTDLLDITGTDVRRIQINDYSFDELRGTMTGNVESVLTRESSDTPWTLAGLDTAAQEVNEEAVQETVDALTNVEIVGVRPKQPGLTADLRIDLTTQRDFDRLNRDLLARGFLLQPNPVNKDLLELLAREGEMSVGIDDGLIYQLYFGRVFTGSDQELEIGLNADKEESGEESGSSEGDERSDGGDAADADQEKEDTKPNGKPGRYVFVRVKFDPALLDGPISEPIEPEEPEEMKALAEKVKQDASEKGEEDAVEGDQAEKDEASDAEETDAQKLQRLREDFSRAKVEYRTQLDAYQSNQQKIKEGEKKSEELNRRFALWYYVIPGESYDKLSLSRDDLVEAKAVEEGATTTDAQANDNALPAIGELSDAVMNEPASLDAPVNEAPVKDAPAKDAPEVEPSTVKPEEKASSEKASDEKAADEKAADEKAADEKAADEKTADEKAADEKAGDEKSAEEKSADESPSSDASEADSTEDEAP